MSRKKLRLELRTRNFLEIQPTVIPFLWRSWVLSILGRSLFTVASIIELERVASETVD